MYRGLRGPLIGIERYPPPVSGGGLYLTMNSALLLIFCLATPDLRQVDNPAVGDWRSYPMCGVNSLYVAARLRGVDVAYEDLVERVPRTEHGSSLADVANAASALGLQGRTVKGAPDALRTLSYPVIAHLQSAESATGHFVVILDEEDGRLLVVDGTTADMRFVQREAFLRDWTGYLVVFEPSPTLWATRVALLVATAAGFPVFFWWRRRHTRPLRP